MSKVEEIIARALALSEAATDGPWEYDPDSDVGAVWSGPAGEQQQVACALNDLDGELIEMARTLLPALAKALGDVLDVVYKAGHSPVALRIGDDIHAAITAALSEVTP